MPQVQSFGHQKEPSGETEENRRWIKQVGPRFRIKSKVCVYSAFWQVFSLIVYFQCFDEFFH